MSCKKWTNKQKNPWNSGCFTQTALTITERTLLAEFLRQVWGFCSRNFILLNSLEFTHNDKIRRQKYEWINGFDKWLQSQFHLWLIIPKGITTLVPSIPTSLLRSVYDTYTNQKYFRLSGIVWTSWNERLPLPWSVSFWDQSSTKWQP